MDGYSVAEELLNGHYRVLRVDYDGRRVYSIDYYIRLNNAPKCVEKLSLGDVTLCYVRLGLCEAVVSIVGSVVELISARLSVEVEGDPAGGSLVKAREICSAEISKLLEAL
jgi:hypothetical protein